MVRYNIEVKYLSFGKEHTSEVYYNASDNLNEEERESVLQGYLDIVETYKGFEGFLESHIWKDKEENKVRVINNHIFREKHMTDEEMEEKQIEFCKSMRENYQEAGKKLEIIEYSMIEVNL